MTDFMLQRIVDSTLCDTLVEVSFEHSCNFDTNTSETCEKLAVLLDRAANLEKIAIKNSQGVKSIGVEMQDGLIRVYDSDEIDGEDIFCTTT